MKRRLKFGFVFNDVPTQNTTTQEADQVCQSQLNSNPSISLPGDSIPIPIPNWQKNQFQFQFLRISRQEWKLLSNNWKSS